MKTLGIVAMVLSLFFLPACTQPQEKFNTTDKLIKTNGNFLVALKKLNRMSAGQEARPEEQELSMQDLSTAPHASIGKFFLVSCYPYKSEKIPPGSSIGDHWLEVLALVDNPNSLLKVSSLDIFLKDDRLSIKPGAPISFAGYFIGTHDTVNAMGGPVEAYVFVSHSATQH